MFRRLFRKKEKVSQGKSNKGRVVALDPLTDHMANDWSLIYRQRGQVELKAEVDGVCLYSGFLKEVNFEKGYAVNLLGIKFLLGKVDLKFFEYLAGEDPEWAAGLIQIAADWQHESNLQDSELAVFLDSVSQQQKKSL